MQLFDDFSLLWLARQVLQKPLPHVFLGDSSSVGNVTNFEAVLDLRVLDSIRLAVLSLCDFFLLECQYRAKELEGFIGLELSSVGHVVMSPDCGDKAIEHCLWKVFYVPSEAGDDLRCVRPPLVGLVCKELVNELWHNVSRDVVNAIKTLALAEPHELFTRESVIIVRVLLVHQFPR